MSDERKEEEIQPTEPQQPLNTGMAEGLEELEAQAAQIAKELQSAGAGETEPAGDEAKTQENPTTEPKPETKPQPEGTTPSGAEPPSAEPKPGAEPKPETLEQQVKRLKDDIRARDGRHGRDKEIWMQELQDLKDQLAETQRKLSAVHAAERSTDPKPGEARPPEPESETIPEPTDEQLKAEFGDDYADKWGSDYAKRMWIVMEKRSRSERKRIRDLVAENAKSAEQERNQAQRLDRAFADLETACPGAGDLNAHAKVNGFGQHLDGYFGETGFTRRQVATMAIDAIKAGATGAEYAAHQKTLVSIFKGFSSAESVVPPNPPPPNPNPNPTTKPDATLYVQPRLAGGDALPKRGETITQAEADRMLDEASRKSPAEFDKVQRLISKKALAGEIR